MSGIRTRELDPPTTEELLAMYAELAQRAQAAGDVAAYQHWGRLFQMYRGSSD